MGTYSSIKIPWTEESGKLQFIGSHGVRHNQRLSRKLYMGNYIAMTIYGIGSRARCDVVLELKRSF